MPASLQTCPGEGWRRKGRWLAQFSNSPSSPQVSTAPGPLPYLGGTPTTLAVMGEQERGVGGGERRQCEGVSGGLLMAGVDAQPVSPCSSGYSSPEKEQERLRRQASLWRGLRPLRLPSALILLLAVLLCTERWPRAASVWPICYDYYVPDQINENGEAGCPLRSADGTLQNTKESSTPCYHTAPWDITSPAPDCRDEGCLKDDDKACCCGASGDRVMGRLDPAVESAPESSGLCSEETWGKFHESGASAGSCRSCRSGQVSNSCQQFSLLPFCPVCSQRKNKALALLRWRNV